jgi:hypothetical protein
MSKAVWYYLFISVACLSIAIYNLTIADQSKNLHCYTIQQMDFFALNNYIKQVGNETQNLTAVESYLTGTSVLKNFIELQNLNSSTSLGTSVTYSIPLEKSNPYIKLQKAIGIIYVILTFLNLLMSSCVNFMMNLTPEDFFNMGRLKRYLGSVCKIVPILNIVVHWVIFIFIIVIWGYVGTKACDRSLEIGAGISIEIGRYYIEIWTLNTVSTGMWLLIHYLGACLRETFYQEPFMYNPPVGKKSCVRMMCFSKLGP